MPNEFDTDTDTDLATMADEIQSAQDAKWAEREAMVRDHRAMDVLRKMPRGNAILMADARGQGWFAGLSYGAKSESADPADALIAWEEKYGR